MAWINGQSLEERIHASRARAVSILYLKLSKARKRLSSWKKLQAFSSDPTIFSKKLEKLNCTQWEFLKVLGIPAEHLYSKGYKPAWTIELEKALENDFSTNRASPGLSHFLERGIIAPFYKYLCSSYYKLGRKIDELGNNQNYQFLSEVADKHIWSFLPSVEYHLRRAVILELNTLRLLGKLPDKDESTQYLRFLEMFEDRDNCLNFLQKYPVLSRYVYSVTNHWLSASLELTKRLNNDWTEICETFGLSLSDRVTAIDFGGDTHNKGRNVCVISFQSNKKIVYKPRNLAIEEAYYEVLDWLTGFDKVPDFKLLKILNKEDHGWVEFVEHITADSDEERASFYCRLGVLSALLYAANSVDIFFENVVAHGEHPVVVDLETLFHTDLERVQPRDMRQTVEQYLRCSVMSLGIFPEPSLSGEEGGIFDISAIGAAQDLKAPYSVTGLANFGRADMHIAKIPGWIPEAKNNPGIENANEVPASELLRGFEIGYGIIEKCKDNLFTDDCAFGRFKGALGRVIVRDTKYYGSLEMDAFHPDLLRDEIDRSWHWDNLWNETLERSYLSDFIGSEMKQIDEHDIPHFSIEVGNNEIRDSDELVFKCDSSQTGWEQAKERVREFSEKDCERQSWLIRSSLGAVENSELPGSNFFKLSPQNSYEDSAIEVGNYLLEKLIWHETQATFLNVRNILPNSESQAFRFSIGKADNSLYEGTAGVSLFLANLGLVTNDQKYTGAAKALANTAFLERNENASISGFLGLGSLTYLLSHLAKICDDSVYLDQARQILPEISILIDKDRDFDVLSGSAGCILSLLPLAKHGITDELENILISCGAHLIENLSNGEFVESLKFRRGFSHGLSGIALALFSLSNIFQDQKYRNLALVLLEAENSLLAHGKWTDEHELYGRCQVSWCHGAPGIALARLKASEMCAESLVECNLGEAIEEVREHIWLDSHCLCHGTLGNIEALVYAARFKKWSSHSGEYRETLGKIHESLISEGWTSLTADQTLNMGLMTGIAGVGYSLLRFARPDVIPSVLLLE